MSVNAVESPRRVMLEGLRDGIPIGLAYFAVAFSLGIAAGSTGLSALQAFTASALCNASAGQYAGFGAIAERATLLSLALVTIIANARYLLMSFALRARCPQDMSLLHRIALSFYLTDEYFAISIARGKHVNPFYTYGAVLFASPCWAIGTALGVIAGNILPVSVVSALGVSLFGMFIAIVIPPARQSRPVALAVAASFALSYAASILPVIRDWSSGTRIIVLTLIISALAAWLFPVREDSGKEASS